MNSILPPVLHPGDSVRVIAPSRSLRIVGQSTREISDRTLANLGLTVTLGDHVEECNEYLTSSIEGRVEDLVAAFADHKVHGILTSIGGFSSIHLLDAIDYGQIAANPKVLCGYSDITVLLNAIHAKTGLITYYGPHYSSFGMLLGNEFTVSNFKKAVFSREVFNVDVSRTWSEDHWFNDQEHRQFKDNSGPVVIQPGEASGILIGGNINAFRLLNGTEYFPNLKGKILFLENDGLDKDITDREFDRRLETILMQSGGDQVQGLVIGRFKTESNMNIQKLSEIVARKRRLQGKPVAYGYDFGHTMPLLTVPIGAPATLIATDVELKWTIEGGNVERT